MSKSFHSPHPLVLAITTSAAATALSYLAPTQHAAEGVGLVFLVATYFGCLRRDHPRSPAHYGLALGGVLLPAPLDAHRIARETARAVLVANLIAVVILPVFFIGFRLWYDVDVPFDTDRVWRAYGTSPVTGLLNLVLAHLLVVALPEEAFFRGYLQTSLEDRFNWSRSIGGIRVSWGLLLSSAIFAVGHVATAPDAGRLAVFFPSLLFGVLRQKTRGIGASVVLHAECNVFAALLGRGYGLY